MVVQWASASQNRDVVALEETRLAKIPDPRNETYFWNLLIHLNQKNCSWNLARSPKPLRSDSLFSHDLEGLYRRYRATSQDIGDIARYRAMSRDIGISPMSDSVTRELVFTSRAISRDIGDINLLSRDWRDCLISMVLDYYLVKVPETFFRLRCINKF
jgi:hypothetical protein